MKVKKKKKQYYNHKLFYNIFTKCWCGQPLIGFYLCPSLISFFYLPIITHHISSLKIFCKIIYISSIIQKIKTFSSTSTTALTPTKNMSNKIVAFSKASFLESPYPPFPYILPSHKPPQKRKPPKGLCSTLSLSLCNVRVYIEE